MTKQEIIDALNFFKNVVTSAVIVGEPVNRVICRQDFRKLVQISETTEWRMMKKGILPERVNIDGYILGYNLLSILKWIEDHSES